MTQSGEGEISRVGVVGCGQMGGGIAEVCARSGLEVVVREPEPGSLAAGKARIETSLDRGVRGGKTSEAQREDALGRLTFTTDLADFVGCDLVVEAIVEDEASKVALFRDLDRVVVAPGAILASNTSSIPIVKLAAVTSRPGQVVGIHFFNPVPVLKLVELIPSLLTDAGTVDRAERFAIDRLGRRVIRSHDRAGFVVNALLVPYIVSAVRMFESGFATAEDIDTGMVVGCNHPMGPLRLADLIGLDTVLAIAGSLYAEFKEPTLAAPPLLSRMVEAGLLGRKSGRGFYDYEPSATATAA